MNAGAIDIGGTNIAVGIVDTAGLILLAPVAHPFAPLIEIIPMQAAACALAQSLVTASEGGFRS